MKKYLAIIVMCVLLALSLICTLVLSRNADAADGFAININGVSAQCESVISNDTHFVPLRKIFEKMDAKVFYRESDNKILALTRDGDTITHIIGQNTITVNGKEKTSSNPSFEKNGETYIPIDMISAAFCPDRIFYEKQQLNIEKKIVTNEYHKVISEVLEASKNSGFNPEKFKRYKDYHGKYPSYSMDEVILRVNMGLDYEFYTNITITDRPYELCVLVNKYNQLPSQFKQYNLVKMDSGYFLNDGKEYLLAGVAYDKYIEMWNAAKKEGLTLTVVSAYRTEDYQRNLYNNKVRTSGKAYADAYSARAGHSEHQTGLAVDIGSTYTVFEYSNEFKWLQKHAHEYGFIMRYPKGKEWITGYAYEPWHYRFVGVEVATKIYEEGITFEEYHAKYKSKNEYR